MIYIKCITLAASMLAGLSSAFAPHRSAPRKWDKHPSKYNGFHVDGREYEAAWHSNATTGNATFQQYIDHRNPELGTFSQFYFWSTEYWHGPGSPIILSTPGEVNVSAYTSYLTTNRTTGVVAKEIGAAIVVIEHRYWGKSSPYSELTTKNMQYLTLENSISDLTNFAKNSRLPFDRKRTSRPTKTPWLMMGGSYSGALSAWTAATQPGTFWAYHASSAPVEAIQDYWQYFVPEQEAMPKNCSTDISRVIDHVDAVFTNGTAKQQHDLKTLFGLQDLEHNDDFGAAIENGPWLWQGNQFYQNSGFYDFCDAIENVAVNSSVLPTAAGVGLEKALSGYADWFNSTLLPGFCASYGYDDWAGNYSIGCFDTYNVSSPLYTDISLSNEFNRQWMWFLCNEPFGYWQDGAPSGRPSLVSRLVNVAYWERQCPLYFPAEEGYQVGILKGKTEDQVNIYTKGWDNLSERLLFVNGDNDPWREASVSSDFRPNGPLQSTPEHPVIIVPGGFHSSDLVTRNGAANADVKAAIDAVVTQLKTWVEEYPTYGH